MKDTEPPFIIDQMAKSIILGKEIHCSSEKIVEQIRERIIDIIFDSTPNRGIEGLGNVVNKMKENWYITDKNSKSIHEERCSGINRENLYKTVSEIVRDIVGPQASTEGFGLYGSYFYGRDIDTPEDLDISIYIGNVSGICIDAQRYRVNDIKTLFTSPRRVPSSNDIGLSIVSKDQFNTQNESYIMTDVSLIDKGTAFTIGKGILASKIPDFVLIKNAQKILYWGLSALLSKRLSLGSRVKEAIFMRNYMIKRGSNKFNLKKYDFSDFISGGLSGLYNKSDFELLCIAKQLGEILNDDEKIIRNHLANNFNHE